MKAPLEFSQLQNYEDHFAEITTAYARFQLKILLSLRERVCVKLLILEGLDW